MEQKEHQFVVSDEDWREDSEEVKEKIREIQEGFVDDIERVLDAKITISSEGMGTIQNTHIHVEVSHRDM